MLAKMQKGLEITKILTLIPADLQILKHMNESKKQKTNICTNKIKEVFAIGLQINISFHSFLSGAFCHANRN